MKKFYIKFKKGGDIKTIFYRTVQESMYKGKGGY